MWKVMELYSILVRVWVWLAYFFRFLVGNRDCQHFLGVLGLMFQMVLVYLLYEIPNVVQVLGFVKVNQLVLDPFQKSEICFPVKGLIVVVKESRDPVEVNEELGGLVIVFHDQLFKFNFGIGNLVVWAEIDHEFFYKFIIVVKPGGFLIQVIRQVRLEVIESCSFQE